MVELYKLPYKRIAACTAPISTNRPHHLAVVAHGANLKVFLDYNPTPVIAVHDAAYACGRFGLIQIGGAATFQNANRGETSGSIPARGLLQWLAFNETTGTLAADSSARGANGTLREGASFSPHGAHGGSAWLDGESGWIDIPDRSFAGDFTLAAWLRLPMPIRIADALVGQEGPGQEINFYGSTLRIHSGKADILAARTATPELIWRHYAVARAGGTVTIFMDGTRDTTGTWTGAFSPQAIGRGSVGFLRGWIDDFAFYDRALDAREIRQLMRHSAQKPQTGPSGTPPKARAAPSRNPQPNQPEPPKP